MLHRWVGASLHRQFPFFQLAEVFDEVHCDADEGRLRLDVGLGVSVGILHLQRVRAFDSVQLGVA